MSILRKVWNSEKAIRRDHARRSFSSVDGRFQGVGFYGAGMAAGEVFFEDGTRSPGHRCSDIGTQHSAPILLQMPNLTQDITPDPSHRFKVLIAFQWIMFSDRNQR